MQKEDLDIQIAEVEQKRNEVDDLSKRTKEQMGKLTNIHTQQIAIDKLENMLEQKEYYIKSLKEEKEALEQSLDEANIKIKKGGMYANILRDNIRLWRHEIGR